MNELRRYVDDTQYRVELDPKNIEILGSAAALLLVAEMERWQKKKRFRFRVINFKKWDPNVRRLFYEMGLFELLDVHNKPNVVYENAALKFLKFVSGRKVTGRDIISVRDKLIKMSKARLLNSNIFYNGIVEAMTNVMNHAYPDGSGRLTSGLSGFWWMSASYDQKSGKITTIFCDQGIGFRNAIPVTLKRAQSNARNEGLKQRALAILEKLNNNDRDVDFIRVATDTSVTSTYESYRGKGLPQILELTKLTENGLLRLISGKGELMVTFDEKGNRVETANEHNISINGTIIQWEGYFMPEGNPNQMILDI